MSAQPDQLRARKSLITDRVFMQAKDFEIPSRTEVYYFCSLWLIKKTINLIWIQSMDSNYCKGFYLIIENYK